MYGIGIWNGLRVTLKHFVDTFVTDLAWGSSKRTQETFEVRQGMQSKGLWTVEYPEEKLAVPERFRFIPTLIVNNYDDPHAPGHDWCTSCGICAKVCPPQCIWIVRGNDPKTGRPKPEPEAFYIDIDICMNCGYCAEYCPFDAIKMGHDYELASYDRTTNHIFDKQKLSLEVRSWQSIAPTTAFEEALVRGQWEHKDTAKVAKKAGIDMTEPIWDKRGAALHNPDIVAQKQQAAAAPRPAATVAGAPAAAARPAGVSINVDTASPEQLAEWAANESLPLPARSAAALRLENLISSKEFKPLPPHRKAISAAKKLAKEQETTIEEQAEKFTPGEVVVAAAAPVAAPVDASPVAQAAPVAAAAPAAISIDVEGANPDQLADWASGESLPLAARAAAAVRLDNLIKEKTFKPTSVHRKAISAAKKAATDAGTTIEDAAQGFTSGEVIAQPAVTHIPVPATDTEAITEAEPESQSEGLSSDNDMLAEINTARELEQKSKNKEIKLSSADRKRISLAKKAAQEAGIEW